MSSDQFPIQGRFAQGTVAVLRGGLSAEREVSGWSADAVEIALAERGYRFVSIDAGHDLPAQLTAAGADVVFVALHGTYGEDGRLQGLLDWMGLPYTGDGIRASVLAMDKGLSKGLYRAADLPVIDDVILRGPDRAAAGSEALPFPLPVVVKPIAEGSSVGVFFAETEAAYAEAMKATAAYPAVLVERMVKGVELSVACLGDQALGCVEIEPARAFYDFDAKYKGGGTRYHLPPRIEADVERKACALGLAAHQALGCRGLTRTDLMLTDAGLKILETNTLPGLTPTSLVPKIMARHGVSFADLVELLLDRATCAMELHQ